MPYPSTPHLEQRLSPQESQRLVHDLQVHQIELETQNSELRNIQVELETSKAELVDLYDMAPVGYCTLSETGRITRSNLTLATLLGLTRNALTDQKLADFIQREHQDVFYLMCKRLAKGQGPQSCELRLNNEVSGPLWAMLDAADSPRGAGEIRLTVVNISAHRNAQEAQRVNDAALKAISQGVIVTTTDLLIVSVNPAFMAITGYSEADSLGRNCRFMQGPETDSHTVAAIRAAMQQSGGFDGEILNYRKDGTPFWNALTISPVLDVQGALTHFVGVTRDITQRKQAEEALREQTETLGAVIQSASDAIVSVDLEGRISLFNPAAERIFGYHAGAMIGMPLERLLPQRYRAIHQGDLRGFAHSQVTRRQMGAGRVQGLSADGRALELEASISQVTVRGRKVLTAILRDVTEREQADEALRATLREKEALLREVHHRVKNNLQVVTSLLRLEAGRSEHATTKSVLMDMRGRIYAMALLHESLYRAGIFASVDLSVYLRQLATQAFRTLATANDQIQLHLELESVLVEMDQATPCGLLVNELISNCFKHGFPLGRGGEVRVQLRAERGGAQTYLVVSDTGVGLPGDFELRRTQSLGLQLVSDLAHQLGGTLEVGPGSRFTVAFTPQRVPPLL